MQAEEVHEPQTRYVEQHVTTVALQAPEHLLQAGRLRGIQFPDQTHPDTAVGLVVLGEREPGAFTHRTHLVHLLSFDRCHTELGKRPGLFPAQPGSLARDTRTVPQEQARPPRAPQSHTRLSYAGNALPRMCVAAGSAILVAAPAQREPGAPTPRTSARTVFRTRRWTTLGYGAGEHEGVAVKDTNRRKRDISTQHEPEVGWAARRAITSVTSPSAWRHGPPDRASGAGNAVFVRV
jgi:hypothetical protein